MNNFQFGAGVGAAYAINKNQQDAAQAAQYNQIVAAYISQGYDVGQARYAADEYFAQYNADEGSLIGTIFFNLAAMVVGFGAVALVIALLIWLTPA